eukprot:102058_1
MRTSRCSALDRRAIQFTSSKQDTTRNRSDQGVPMIRYVMSIWAIIVVVFNFGPSLILCAGNDDLNDGPCGIKAKRVGKQIANLRCDYQELLYTLRRFGAIHYDWAVQSSAVSKKLKLSWPVQWGSLKTLLRSGCSIVPTEPPEVRTLDGLVNAFPVPPGYELVILQDRLADVTLPALPATTSTDIYEYGDNDRADGGNRVSKNQYNKNKKHKKMKDKYEMKMSGTKSNYKETTTGIYDSSYTGDNDGGDNGKRVAKIKRKKRKNTKECVKCKVRKSEETQLKKCSRCRQPLYCSRKCQKIHWKKKHRYNCVEYSDDSLHDALSPSNPEDCWNKTQTSTSSQMSMRFMSAQACPYDIHVCHPVITGWHHVITGCHPAKRCHGTSPFEASKTDQSWKKREY